MGFLFWFLKNYRLLFKSSILKMMKIMDILLNGYDLTKSFCLKRNFI
ncbi:hypothetical protein HPHPH9_1171 [Helicobacter pylori Hp H-9]|nr:hypothetical protein HPHPH9_1171 [Helicobacter pylori Hp H-9]